MPEIRFVLDDILKERNISQIELSNLTGIRPQSIANLRKNNAERVTLDHLVKIMTALEITDVGEILHYVTGEPESTESTEDEDPLDNPIEMLDLSPRAFNAVKRIPFPAINTIKDLLEFDFSDRRRFKTANLGAVTIKEIKEALESYVKKHK